jgi:hypothetical protein
VKYVLALGISAVLIAYFSHRASTAFHAQGKRPSESISNVGDLLERASSRKPLDGRPAPDKRWVTAMNAACAKRENDLAAIPRAGTAAGIAARTARTLDVYREYAARVEALRIPSAYRAEGREIRDFNGQQERILARVAAAARAGDLGLASRESVALRELAGRANAVFLRLGLESCAFGSSGMPL